MSYRFGKIWHLAIIWAIRKAFQCIPQGVRFLLANHTRLSPTSENDSYCWKGISITLTSKDTNNVCQTWIPPKQMSDYHPLPSLRKDEVGSFLLQACWPAMALCWESLVSGELKNASPALLCSLHAHVLLGRVKRTAEKRTNPWHSNLARRPLVRLLANKCLHLLLHNPHFPPLTTSNGKFSLQWQNITYVVYALFQ